MIYAEIKDRLLANAALKATIGDRVYGLRAPETVRLPFIIVTQDSKVPIDKLNGVTGTYFCTYSVSIYGEVPDHNATLAALVRTQLNGWIDNTSGKTIRSFLENEADVIVEIEGTELEINRIEQSYEMSYAEA